MKLRNQLDSAVLGDIYYANAVKRGEETPERIQLELVELPNPFLKNFEVFRHLVLDVYYIIDSDGKIIHFQDASIPQDDEVLELQNILSIGELIELRKKSLERRITSDLSDPSILKLSKLFYKEIKAKEEYYSYITKCGEMGKLPISEIISIFGEDFCSSEHSTLHKSEIDINDESPESTTIDVRNIRFCIFSQNEKNLMILTEFLGIEDDCSIYYDFFGKNKIRVGKDKKALDNIIGPSIFTYFTNAKLERTYTILGIINAILDNLRLQESLLSTSTISDLETFKEEIKKMIEEDNCVIDFDLIKEKIRRIRIIFKNINGFPISEEELENPVLISVKGGKEIK